MYGLPTRSTHVMMSGYHEGRITLQVSPYKAPPFSISNPTMTPAFAISTVAFLLLWSPSGAAARRRRVGSGSSSYCVDDYDQRVLCGNTIASIVGGAISGLCSLNCFRTAHIDILTTISFQFYLSSSTTSVWPSGVATSGDVGCFCLKLPPPKITRRRAL